MDIEMRVRSLERSARRWRAATLGLVALACVAAQAQPTVTRFDEIRLRRLTLNDRQDRPRAVLDVDDRGPGVSLVLFDEDENAGVRIEIAPDGLPAITLKDPKSRARFVADISEHHVGTVLVTDRDFKVVGRLPR